MTNIQKWGEFTVEAATETEQQIASGGTFWKAKVGKNKIRVLPPPPGQAKPWIITYEHRVEVPGSKRPVTFCCPRVMAKQVCPMCQKADELSRSGNPADVDRAADLRPRMRAYMNIIDRREPEKGVQIYAAGKTVIESMAKIRKDEDIGGNFTHPTEGFDLIIERTGTSKNDTEYSVFPSKQVTPLAPPDELDAIREDAPDLGRFSRLKTIDEIKKEMAVASGQAVGTTRQRTAQDDVEGDIGF